MLIYEPMQVCGKDFSFSISHIHHGPLHHKKQANQQSQLTCTPVRNSSKKINIPVLYIYNILISIPGVDHHASLDSRVSAWRLDL